MLTLLHDLTGDVVVGVVATGRVPKDDDESVPLPAVGAACAEHPTPSLLYHVDPGFEGSTAAAAWDDAKLDVQHRPARRRSADVTDTEWRRAASKALGVFPPPVVRVFGDAELEAAEGRVAGA